MDLLDAQQMIQQNNAWSAAQAQKQMDFQERMSNTAHQREIADLKASGLNPVLSAKLGGASTPSGAMGDTDTSGTSTLIQMAMQTASAAGSAARAAANATERVGTSGQLIDILEGGIKYLPKKYQALAYGLVQAFDNGLLNSAIEGGKRLLAKGRESFHGTYGSAEQTTRSNYNGFQSQNPNSTVHTTSKDEPFLWDLYDHITGQYDPDATYHSTTYYQMVERVKHPEKHTPEEVAYAQWWLADWHNMH